MHEDPALFASLEIGYTVDARWRGNYTPGRRCDTTDVRRTRQGVTISAARYAESDVIRTTRSWSEPPVSLAGCGGIVSLVRWLRRGGAVSVWRVAVSTESFVALSARRAKC